MTDPTNYDDDDVDAVIGNHLGTGAGVSESGLTALPASDLNFDEENQS